MVVVSKYQFFSDLVLNIFKSNFFVLVIVEEFYKPVESQVRFVNYSIVCPCKDFFKVANDNIPTTIRVS